MSWDEKIMAARVVFLCACVSIVVTIIAGGFDDKWSPYIHALVALFAIVGAISYAVGVGEKK